MFSVNVVSVNVVSVNTLSANVALCAQHVFLCLGAQGEGAGPPPPTPKPRASASASTADAKAGPPPPKMKRERDHADEASIACMRCVVSVAVFSVKTNHVKSDSVVNNA